MHLTWNELIDRFDYHRSGWLIRKSTGRACGTIKARYVHINIDRREYLAHRVIWFWHTGVWPGRLDHWNGEDWDNRFENLRECNQVQNQGNADWGPMRGIERHGRKYRVRISTEIGKIELGSYFDLEDAKSARDAGHRDYFGKFAFCERPSQ